MAEFYYYVKKGGAALGDAGRSATKRTGSFAAMGTSAYYDSIYDVFAGGVPTTAPAAGDLILVSALHAKTYATNVTFGVSGFVDLYSVSDANADTYSKGASERITSGNHLTLFADSNACNYSKGIDFQSGYNLNVCAGAYSSATLEDCELTIINGGNRYLYASSGFGGYLKLVGVELNFSGANQGINIQKASVIAENISLTGVAVNHLFTGADYTSGAATLSDSSLPSGIATAIFNYTGTRAHSPVVIERCVLPAALPLVDTFDAFLVELVARNLAFSNNPDTYYHFESHSRVGISSTETAIYRTAGADYDGTNGFSTEIISNANTSFSNPLRVEIYHGYVDTADYTTAVDFKVHFAVDGSAIALNSDEVYLEIEHADGADNALGVLASTAPDPLAAGVAPTTELGLWAGLTATNKQMSINKSATIGATAGTIASGIIRAYICVAKPSQTIFACPEVVIS